MNESPTPSGLSQRLSLILQSLRAVLAASVGRDRAAAAMVLLAWPYLHRIAARFAALAGRVAAGHAAVAPVRAGAARERSRAPSPALPRRPGWLLELAPGARALAGQVRHLLASPEFSALLAAAPQSGRILRPLCRMLGIVAGPGLPPGLFLPPERVPPASVVAAVVAAIPATPHDASPIAPPPATPAPRPPPSRARPLRPPRFRLAPA